MSDVQEISRAMLANEARNLHAIQINAKAMMHRVIERLDDYPDAKNRLTAHLADKDNEMLRLEEILRQLGEDTSAFKDSTMSMMGGFAGLMTGALNDDIIKSSMLTYGLANYEICAYEGMIFLAEKAKNRKPFRFSRNALLKRKPWLIGSISTWRRRSKGILNYACRKDAKRHIKRMWKELRTAARGALVPASLAALMERLAAILIETLWIVHREAGGDTVGAPPPVRRGFLPLRSHPVRAANAARTSLLPSMKSRVSPSRLMPRLELGRWSTSNSGRQNSSFPTLLAPATCNRLRLHERPLRCAMLTKESVARQKSAGFRKI
jgi:ferritin-like metal-binding protein YciE